MGGVPPGEQLANDALDRHPASEEADESAFARPTPGPPHEGEGSAPARFRKLKIAAASLALLLTAATGSLLHYATTLPPLDLTAATERSTVVLDRDGKLLRPFLTADGRWKLPVGTGDVDPRYLAMLKAYEDRRFDSHAGIDPLGSCARPARCCGTAESSPAARP